MRTASIFLLALFQKGRVSAQDAVQPRPFNYRGMRILFTTMMLALITYFKRAPRLKLKSFVKPHVKVNSLLKPQFRDFLL